MNNALNLILLTLLMGTASPATAQDNTQAMPAPPVMENEQTLVDRYQICIDSKNCTAQERFMLMRQMNDEMARMVRQMEQNCMQMNYMNCMEQQSSDVEQWKKMHGHMGDMMEGMVEPTGKPMKESRVGPWEENTGFEDDKIVEELTKQEPAAGETKEQSAAKQSWWRRFFRSGEKPETEDTNQ